MDRRGEKYPEKFGCRVRRLECNYEDESIWIWRWKFNEGESSISCCKMVVPTEGTHRGKVQLLFLKAGHAACCTCFPHTAWIAFHRIPFGGAQWCCPSPTIAAVRVGVWLGYKRHHCPTEGTRNNRRLQMCPNPFNRRSWPLLLLLQLLSTLVADFVGNILWGMQRHQFVAPQTNWAVFHLGYI